MCVYRDPALDLIVNAQAAWTSPLLPTADELADRYSLVAGLPLAHWEFYMALAYFKLAIIAAGIDFRRRMSDQARGAGDAGEHTPEVVAPLISRGLAELASCPASAGRTRGAAARRSCKIRAVPTATVISPPTTAASKIATPRGRLQCQPKNRKSVGTVFWVMKISNRIRITKPAISDDHSAPARVNPIAGSLVDAPVLPRGRAWGRLSGRRRVVAAHSVIFARSGPE